MPSTPPKTTAELGAVTRTDCAMLCVSLELSLKTWLVTLLAPGSDKMSRYKIEGGDDAGLLDLLWGLQGKAAKRLGASVRIMTIQEAGLDGFWLDRLELVKQPINDVEAAGDALLVAQDKAAVTPGKLLLQLRSIGPEIASVLWLEGFYRSFDNRRQLAAFSGLAPSPWRRGNIDHEQGISKSGNAKLRTTMIELSWLWLRYQPNSELSHWFQARVRGNSTRRDRKITIVAMARKLLIALFALRNPGGFAGRRRAQGRRSPLTTDQRNPRGLISLAGSGLVDRSEAWLKDAVQKIGPAFLSPNAPWMEDLGAAVLSSDRM